MDHEKYDINDFKGIYKELVELLGVEKTLLFHKHFRGMQITFPVKLFSMESVMRKVKKEYNGHNLRTLSHKYEYSERWIRKQLTKIELTDKKTFK